MSEPQSTDRQVTDLQVTDLQVPHSHRDDPAAPRVTIARLKNRADFLRAAKGRRWHGKAFSLQSAPTEALGAGEARVGFTVTKKVGGSVVRNRARRRLREALRLNKALLAEGGHDYVIVARVEALRLPFSVLQRDLARAVRGVHAARPDRLSAARTKDASSAVRAEDASPAVGATRPSAVRTKNARPAVKAKDATPAVRAEKDQGSR